MYNKRLCDCDANSMYCSILLKTAIAFENAFSENDLVDSRASLFRAAVEPLGAHMTLLRAIAEARSTSAPNV